MFISSSFGQSSCIASKRLRSVVMHFRVFPTSSIENEDTAAKSNFKKNTWVPIYFFFLNSNKKKIKRIILQKWKEKKCLKVNPLERKCLKVKPLNKKIKRIILENEF